MSTESEMLDDRVKRARESLEAAQTSVQAAEKRFGNATDPASAEFLHEARLAYDDAQAEYDRARGAEAGSSGTTTDPTASS